MFDYRSHLTLLGTPRKRKFKLELSQALQASPRLFPFHFDEQSECVQFLGLSEQDYLRASFLDSRMLTGDTKFAAIPWKELVLAAAHLPLRCHFIFHTSHCGSTLISRLLGSHPACFSLREPAILRTIAENEQTHRLDTFLKLWSRTYQPLQTTVIKATSFVSEIATTLMERVESSRSLLLYIPPQSFLPALLDGAMSDIDGNAARRLSRLQREGIANCISLSDLSDGERVAMSWLAEMNSMAMVATEFNDRVLWVDFEDFLLNVESKLNEVIDHLGFLKADLRPHINDIMQRYAKRTDVKYDSNFRNELLVQAKEKHRMEVSRGLQWIERHIVNTPGLPSHFGLR